MPFLSQSVVKLMRYGGSMCGSKSLYSKGNDHKMTLNKEKQVVGFRGCSAFEDDLTFQMMSWHQLAANSRSRLIFGQSQGRFHIVSGSREFK